MNFNNEMGRISEETHIYNLSYKFMLLHQYTEFILLQLLHKPWQTEDCLLI